MVDVTAISDNNLTQSYLVDRPIVSFGLSVYVFAITDTPAESAQPALIYTKSDDSGKIFGSSIVLATATAGGGVNGAAIYYDRWTRGNTGTKIHIVFTRQNSSGVFYTSIETLTDVQGSVVTLFSGVASSVVARHTCSICVTAGGNILAPWVLPIATGNQGMSRSTDGGVSFSTRISPWNSDSPVAAINDVVVITPANSGDDNDADIYFLDESGQTVVLRQYRDATNTLDGDVSIDASVAIANPDTPFMHACHDHADGTTIFGLRDGPINVAHNFTIRRINGGASIVSLPNVYTAQTNRMGTGLCINNQNGDIYAAYNDSITPFSVQRNFIVKLPFGAGSFDAPIQNSTTDRDYNDIWLPTSIGDAGGIVLGLAHEQGGTQIHYVNPDNSVEIEVFLNNTISGSIELTYTPFFGGSSLNIVFDMQMESWKHILTPQPILTNLANFENRSISLNKVNFDIEITGVAVTHHEAHPLIADEGHVPDVTDLEEMAILFNRGISAGFYVVARLDLVTDVDLTRRYQGVIKNLILFQEGGINVWRFKLLFGVDWNISQPLLREWA